MGLAGPLMFRKPHLRMPLRVSVSIGVTGRDLYSAGVWGLRLQGLGFKASWTRKSGSEQGGHALRVRHRHGYPSLLSDAHSV